MAQSTVCFPQIESILVPCGDFDETRRRHGGAKGVDLEASRQYETHLPAETTSQTKKKLTVSEAEND